MAGSIRVTAWRLWPCLCSQVHVESRNPQVSDPEAATAKSGKSGNILITDRISPLSPLLAPTVYAMDHNCRLPEETVFQKPQRHWRFSGSGTFIRLLGFRPWCVAMTGGNAVLGFSSKVRIGYYSMHSICLILWFQERTHQAASSGAVPNDHDTERSSFCSAFASADETTLGKSLTNVCRLWQRDLSFLSSFRVIAPQATAASPENVWMHHRNICWECWMYALVDSNLSFFSRLVDILMKKTVARMAYLLAVSPTMYNYSVGIKQEKLRVLSCRRVWGSNALPQTTSPWSWQTAQGEA